MKCNKAKLYMSLKLDDALSNRQNRLLKTHLACCKNCQQRWQDLQKQESLFQELSFADPGEDYWDSYHVDLASRFPLRRYVAAAAILFAVIGLYFFQFKAIDENNQLYKLAAIGDREAQQVLLQREKASGSVNKLYFMQNNRFHNVEKFVLQLLAQRKNFESFDDILHIYTYGKEKTLALYDLWQMDTKRALPFVVAALKEDKLYSTAISLLKEAEQTTCNYLCANMYDTPLMWRTLGDLRGNYSLALLNQYAQNNSKEAVIALGKRGSTEAAQILFACMHRYQLREPAVQSLQYLRPFSTEVIHEKIRQDDVVAIELAQRIFNKDTPEVLMNMALHTTHFKQVATTLATMNDHRSVDFFIQLTNYKKYRAMALSALATVDTPRTNRFLLKGLYDEKLHSEFLQALQNSKDTRIIEPIVRVAFRKGLSRLAMNVLLNMPKKEVIPYFIAMLRSSRLRKNAHLALKQLTNEDFGTNQYLWMMWWRRGQM
ncbi:anti-sigma factor family protein [Candidatus Uabimicrobium amorphum]|uniref:Zinc-finger domain-containing protein n=1 Tax=Uabimicrobium amorphum TaxID=2596890 RepID=A0A5S9IS12_UABAM|nr:zf-HC2 domain-containing protein [Candidatus Uabimicrobium amorphum]BBM85615.1 hypothetical protein UABAM_03989 [Candidatus Uabimicrobium amorphum]